MNIINHFISTAHAVTSTTTTELTPVTVSTVDDIIKIVGRIGGYMAFALYAVAAIYIVLAAFAYLQSGGDPKNISAAKTKIIYAAVAIAVALLASSIGTIIRAVVAG